MKIMLNLSSATGYSVGRWEADTLVVETTRINWPYFDRVGAPLSEDAGRRRIRRES